LLPFIHRVSNQAKEWWRRQDPWPWLAAVVAVHQLLVVQFTQNNPGLGVTVLLLWGGALIVIEDLLPGFKARPSRWGLILGTLLLALVQVRMSYIISRDFAVVLAGPLLGMALLMLAAPLRGWRPFVPALFILSLMPLPRLISLLHPEKLTSFAAAQLGGIVLQAFGLNAIVEGRNVILPAGSVTVIRECNGIDIVVQCFLVAVIFLIAFPLQSLWKKILILLTAPVVGFFINSFRVALLALLVDSKVTISDFWFNFFHDGAGGLLFAAVAVSLVCWLHVRLVLGELAHD
jgi:cyanoexosortase A